MNKPAFLSDYTFCRYFIISFVCGMYLNKLKQYYTFLKIIINLYAEYGLLDWNFQLIKYFTVVFSI